MKFGIIVLRNCLGDVCINEICVVMLGFGSEEKGLVVF